MIRPMRSEVVASETREVWDHKVWDHKVWDRETRDGEIRGAEDATTAAPAGPVPDRASAAVDQLNDDPQPQVR